MKNNETYKDQGLRLATQHKNEAAERMTPSEDFADRLMQRIEQEGKKPKHRRVWLYFAIGAAAAGFLLLLTLQHYNEETKTLQHLEAAATITEQRDSTATDNVKEEKTMIAQEKPVVDKVPVVNQLPKVKASAVDSKTSTEITSTDSLDYYIDKIERELAQVDESLYIEKMNRIIRADDRLQRIVNSYILHNLDKEGRPQTADNSMYNEKTEQDDE